MIRMCESRIGVCFSFIWFVIEYIGLSRRLTGD